MNVYFSWKTGINMSLDQDIAIPANLETNVKAHLEREDSFQNYHMHWIISKMCFSLKHALQKSWRSSSIKKLR